MTVTEGRAWGRRGGIPFSSSPADRDDVRLAENDLKALRLVHNRVIDTAIVCL